jgi:hypothetical protein
LKLYIMCIGDNIASYIKFGLILIMASGGAILPQNDHTRGLGT